MDVHFAKKTGFFIVCLFAFSVNVLASVNTFAGFQRHEPNTPRANWIPAIKSPTAANPVAYFHDDELKFSISMTGMRAGETWSAEVLPPNPDGTPGSRILLAYSPITWDGRCFTQPGRTPVCFTIPSGNGSIAWWFNPQCQPTGTWTIKLKNNGVVFKTAYVDLLPKVDDVNVLARRFAVNQGAYPQSYDSICHPKTGRRAVNCQDPNATAMPYSIAAKGCLISSLDMVMKYHGRNAAFAASPVALNAHLARGPDPEKVGGTFGYTKGGNFKLRRLDSFPGGNVRFDKKIKKRNDALLLQKLCAFGPTPIAVKGNLHFVVATGFSNLGKPSQTIEILDPAGGVATTLAQRYGNTYSGIRSYAGPGVPPVANRSMIEVRAYSPVQLFLTDPLGRRLGFDKATGQMVNEIPGGSYGEEPELSLDPTFVDPDPTKVLSIYNNVANGAYKLDVIGTGTGTYDLTFMFEDANSNPFGGKGINKVPVTLGAVHTYTFNYNSAPGSVMMIGGGAPAPGVNHPPVADAGPNQAVECAAGLANVTLNGAGSSDPDGDPLTYRWSGPFGVATGVKPIINLPLGTHVITLTVNDGKGGVATATSQVTVQDTTPPVVNAGANITIPATGPNGAPFNLQPAVSDTCCITNVVISPRMPTYPVGTTAITATATDCAGNTASSMMQLTVQAVGAPPVPPTPNPNLGAGGANPPNPPVAGNGGGQTGTGVNPPSPSTPAIVKDDDGQEGDEDDQKDEEEDGVDKHEEDKTQ